MRLPKPRRVKVNLSYSVAELADTCDVHRTTVRRWLKEGLTPIEDRKPYLFHGTVARAFLTLKCSRNKKPSRPGEMYCMRCHRPRIPASNMAHYCPRTETIGTLIGWCPDCGTSMHRYLALARLAQARGNLVIAMTESQ
jgi:hypothetical protein